MVRLSDLHETEAEHLRERVAAMPQIDAGEWVVPRPLAESTIAIVSTAGIHRRTDAPFTAGALDYRIVPGDASFDEMVLSHISSNFDRSAFELTANTKAALQTNLLARVRSFPIEASRLKEAAVKMKAEMLDVLQKHGTS